MEFYGLRMIQKDFWVIAFTPSRIRVKNSSSKKAYSFSCIFAFAIVPQFETLGGHGFAFAFVPDKKLIGALPSQYLGLLNSSDNGNRTNHVFAIKFDEVQDFEFKDINDNHVGVNINSMISNVSANAAYYVYGNSSEAPKNISMKSRETIMCWIDYDSSKKQLNVSLSPLIRSRKGVYCRMMSIFRFIWMRKCMLGFRLQLVCLLVHIILWGGVLR